ncbi:MAG TPA: hypothetical protein VGI85_05785 [Chthoniobacterales bacterium]
MTDGELYQTLLLAKSLGVITTAHCENADLVQQLQEKFLREGKTGPEWHYWSRPPAGGSGRSASPHDLRGDGRRARIISSI